MKDVAKIACVSISTVSRVINQNIPVDEKTKKRVLVAVEKLNYKPNLLAKGLRVKSGHLIGFVVPEIRLHSFVNWINGVEEYAVKNGFNLILGNTHNDPNVEEMLIDNLIRRNVDGIVLTRASDESRVLNRVRESKVRIVALDRELELEEVPSVVLDNYKGGEIAAGYLLKLGHRQIACITGPLNIKLCRERLHGFKDVLKKQDVELPEKHLFEGDFKFESGIRAVDGLLSTDIGITAIWAHNDLMAIGALKALNNKGIKVPKDVSLMGMDDLEVARMITPSLTTITQPFKEMSERAVEILLQQTKQEVKIPQKIVLEPNLVIRDSTGYIH